MAFQEITSPPMLDSTAQDMVSVLRQIYSKYDVEKSTLREVPFGVGVNDWVASDDVYVATVSSAYVTTTSKEFATFTATLRSSAKGDISVDKIHGGGGITLTTNVLPIGTINGTLYVIDADDGKVPILIEDTVVPVSNGGTGSSTVSGAQDILGITALNDTIGNTALPTTAQTLTGAIAEHEQDIASQNDNIAKLEVLTITFPAFSSLPQTVSNAAIETDMVCLQSVLSNPPAQTGDWTVNTDTAGQVTVSGSISGSTTLTLYLMKSRT